MDIVSLGQRQYHLQVNVTDSLNLTDSAVIEYTGKYCMNVNEYIYLYAKGLLVVYRPYIINTGSTAGVWVVIYTIVKPYRCRHTVVYSLANLHINCECMGVPFWRLKQALVSSYQRMSSYKPVIMIAASGLWSIHEWLSSDRARGRRVRMRIIPRARCILAIRI